MTNETNQPVLILGGGINGAAVARELLLNGVPVCLVDLQDIACGATSRSSRLIHGGLRYLEHGDFALVRESLAERSRLHRLAPQFVTPLRLHIPVNRRTGGWIRSVLKFLRVDRWPGIRRLLASKLLHGARGLWLVQFGLWVYDRFAADEDFERSHTVAANATGVPPVNAASYRWQCVYADGQMRYPERFVVALLEDARSLAEEQKLEFHLLTYHRAERHKAAFSLHSLLEPQSPPQEVVPRLVINATGAWGDLTLGELHQPSPRLFGGTKGSHLLTRHPQLRAAVNDGGVYAEADDGRLIFVLPFGESVLVGTTDDRFEERPESAIATNGELQYLLELVNDLFPQFGLTEDDIDMHYAGVRPLPYQPKGKAAAIPRGHSIVWNDAGEVPVLTLVGGKLTTCRALAEEVVAAVAGRLELSEVVTSRNRTIPGGESYPADEETLAREKQRLAEEVGVGLETTRAMWSLCGTSTRGELAAIREEPRELLPGTALPIAWVRRVIEREWVSTLDDLVERRLMLLFQPDLSIDTLRELAACFGAEEKLQLGQIDAVVAAYASRLHEVYGKQLNTNSQQTPLAQR